MRFRRSTTIGMITAGVGTVALLSPIAFGVLSLRSTREGTGAEPVAWLVVGVVVLLAALVAAAAGGALVALVRRVYLRLRARRP